MIKGYGEIKARSLVDLQETVLSVLNNNPELGCLYSDTGEVEYDCIAENLKAFRMISELGLKRDEISQLLSLPKESFEFLREFHDFIGRISRAYNISTSEAVFLAIRVVDNFYMAGAKLEEIKHEIGELDALKNMSKTG